MSCQLKSEELKWRSAGGMVREAQVGGVSDYHAGMLAAVELLESEAQVHLTQCTDLMVLESLLPHKIVKFTD